MLLAKVAGLRFIGSPNDYTHSDYGECEKFNITYADRLDGEIEAVLANSTADAVEKLAALVADFLTPRLRSRCAKEVKISDFVFKIAKSEVTPAGTFWVALIPYTHEYNAATGSSTSDQVVA